MCWMQITLSGYQNNLFMLDVQRKAARAPVAAPTTQATPAFQPSSLTMLAAAHSFSELAVQGQATTVAYCRDGSLALRASSSGNIHVRSQEVALDVILSADALGAPLPADLFKNGPLTLSLEYHFETAEIDQHIQSQTIRPARKIEDILTDLTEALIDVMRRRGDKNVQVLFDEEAVKALFSDPKTARLMKEIAGLLTMVNAMVLEGGPRHRYTIAISGKGRPYLNE
jgi:hypothetical protein